MKERERERENGEVREREGEPRLKTQTYIYTYMYVATFLSHILSHKKCFNYTALGKNLEEYEGWGRWGGEFFNRRIFFYVANDYAICPVFLNALVLKIHY